MLRVFQEDKMTVKHFHPGKYQILWRHRFLFRSYRSIRRQQRSIFKTREWKFSKRRTFGNQLYRTRLDERPIRKKRFEIRNGSISLDEAWKL